MICARDILFFLADYCGVWITLAVMAPFASAGLTWAFTRWKYREEIRTGKLFMDGLRNE